MKTVRLLNPLNFTYADIVPIDCGCSEDGERSQDQEEQGTKAKFLGKAYISISNARKAAARLGFTDAG